MIIDAELGKHVKYKIRKKKGGVKLKLRKSIKQWLKERDVAYCFLSDGHRPTIIMRGDVDDELVWHLTWD